MAITLGTKTSWLKHRLQTMGPAEVLARLAEVGRHVALYSALRSGYWRVRQQARRCTPGVWPLPALHGCCDGVQRDVQMRVLTAAEKWLQHRVSFFALCDTPLGESIDWHRDYASGRVSSLKYSGLINHRAVALTGDVKYIWELNRLHQLVLLALAARWTGCEAYRDAIDTQTRSWQAQNPFMHGLNWKSPLEAGMRLISWAMAMVVMPVLRQTMDGDALAESVYQHQYFIRAFHSKHSSANNHLIGEMAGLYVGTIFWPGYRESASWRTFARRMLQQALAEQVTSDGVGKERATEYQLFIAEFFLLVGALGQVVGDPFPPAYWERLARLLTFVAAISDRAGHLPLFGDGDSAQAVWLPETTPERAQALARLGQARAGEETELRSTLLVWGQAPKELPLSASATLAQEAHAFPEGGYYVLAADRGGEDELVVVFDVGPLGLAPLYAHGHADALSFWLSYGGHEFLIDPGTYCYNNHTAWRAYFRGTAAHNTVRVDGEDQSVAAGTFLWRHVARCEAEDVRDNATFVEVAGYHDGYLRLSDPVLHRRRLRLDKKGRILMVTDVLECRDTHEVEISFHFSEACTVWQAARDVFLAAHGTRRLRLHLDARLTPTLYRGSEEPIAGWVSRTFDVKVPTVTLVARGRITSTTEFRTEIIALDAGAVFS
jgi:uncharacterized heparinase superfamily protein